MLLQQIFKKKFQNLYSKSKSIQLNLREVLYNYTILYSYFILKTTENICYFIF